MKKFILIVFILCTSFVHSYSQDSIFSLHAAVGDTIDIKEKIDFDLFHELKNSDFKFGIIYFSGETKKLNVHTQNESIIVIQLDSTIIIEYQSNINKLLDFYSTQNRNDTVLDLNNRFYLYDSSIKKRAVNNIIIDKAAMEKSAYDGRRKQHLRTAALENGVSGQKLIDAQNFGSYGEIKFKKK